MIKFKNIHFYKNQSHNLNFNIIVSEIQKYFPKIPIDLRTSLLNNINDILAENLISIRISDIKKPFYKQPKLKDHEKLDKDIVYEMNFPKPLILRGINNDSSINNTESQSKELILYDGFMMQRLLETMINENYYNTDHVNIVFEDRLICTFAEEDWRYHARTFVAGNPSIISTTGIIEAPAKPKEWYIKQMQLAIYDTDNVDDNHNNGLSLPDANKYLDYDDFRINFAAIGYILQILFFFITEGNPFCDDINCKLYNAHWQRELIQSQIENSRLCDEHCAMLHQFNTL